ncbi:MAG TPA: GNAT family N-acetyltransferase [Bacillota bacterium]|nr:GNAT family N-acetyltransferase [Bacillota bacterium]
MAKYQLIERIPTVDELFALRGWVGWQLGEKDAFSKGLDRSLYGVCAMIDGEVVGIARVVGDGFTCFYIQDVIVKPEFQKMGIGKSLMGKVMQYITKNATTGAIVGLMAAKGKESFYEKFGFWRRPNEYFGHGMMQFWNRTY